MVWAEGATNLGDLAVFAQFGAIGVIAAGGIMFARGAYRREVERADRLEAEKNQLHTEQNQLHTVMIDRIVPAMQSAVAAAQESAALLAALQREREIERALREAKGGDATHEPRRPAGPTG